MGENDTILIQELKSSFSLQLGWYKDLLNLDRKMMSRLVLSRGDMSGIVSSMEKKNRLIDMIQMERDRTFAMISLWQQRKNNVSHKNSESYLLDKILEQIENVIQDFLLEEDQLKNYINGLIKKNPDNQNAVN
jgi:hypothetical protein